MDGVARNLSTGPQSNFSSESVIDHGDVFTAEVTIPLSKR